VRWADNLPVNAKRDLVMPNTGGTPFAWRHSP
jgi:hypothetical protein